MSSFFWPRAEFWRAWGVAALLSIVSILVFMNLQPAHAEGFSWHHHHHWRAHHFRHHRHVPRRHHRRHHSREYRAPPEAQSEQGSSEPASDTVAIAMRYLGSGNPTGSHGAWCGDFMNLVEHLAGRSGIRSRLAIDWARYGRPTAPVRGAIVVLRTRAGFHVAQVVDRVGDRLRIISGNWSHRVGIGWASLRSAVAFRMP